MKNHTDIQSRLKAAIQEAIMTVGEIDGTNEVALTNTDVIEALLEVTGLWAAAHGFEDYSPRDLALEYARRIEVHIKRLGPILRSGRLPVDIIPRRRMN
jgi:hypothetical protein